MISMLGPRLLLFLSVEHEEIEPSIYSVSMELAFQNIALGELSALTYDYPPAEICRWPCSANLLIVCEDGVITEFKIEGFEQTLGDFIIGFFPQTMEKLSIVLCGQKFKIDTRMFPQKSRTIDLAGNAIHGTPDLATLPPFLEDLILPSNLLSGPIHFCELPKTLSVIQLGFNQINQKIVYYDNLPPNIWKISLRNNQIGEIRVIPEHPKLESKKIFTGVSEKNIN